MNGLTFDGAGRDGTVEICQGSSFLFGLKCFLWQQEEEYWERRPAVDKNEVSLPRRDVSENFLALPDTSIVTLSLSHSLSEPLLFSLTIFNF